jgi:hypothetical protein
VGLSQLESIEGPGRCSGRCWGGQAEMVEHLGDHGGMFDGGDDLQGATAPGALPDVDLEHWFTKTLSGSLRPKARFLTPLTKLARWPRPSPIENRVEF